MKTKNIFFNTDSEYDEAAKLVSITLGKLQALELHIDEHAIVSEVTHSTFMDLKRAIGLLENVRKNIRDVQAENF